MWAIRRVPGPISTSEPTMQCGPMSALAKTRARGSINAVGWIGMLRRSRGLGLVCQFAQDFGFGHEPPVDSGAAGHLGNAGLALDHRHFDAQRVAWYHGPAKTGVLDRRQKHQLLIAV